MNQPVFHTASLIPYSQNGSCHPGGDLVSWEGYNNPKNGGKIHSSFFGVISF